MGNLVEALQKECDKGRRHIAQLEETARLFGKKSADDDPGLRVSKQLTRQLIAQTEAAIASGDVVRMVQVARLHGIGEGEETE